MIGANRVAATGRAEYPSIRMICAGHSPGRNASRPLVCGRHLAYLSVWPVCEIVTLRYS